MKKYIILLVAVMAVSCGKTVSEEDLSHLNGYWSIEKAVMPDESVKEYKVNPTIDYFEIKDKEGFRKKVMPQVDGTYRTNNSSEDISIVTEEGKTYISYVTEFAKWKEQILELDSDHLVLKNEQDIEYYYTKPEPFTLK